jgi:hypothetical protein
MACAAPIAPTDPDPTTDPGGNPPMSQGEDPTKLPYAPGLTTSFDSTAGTLQIDGYDFSIRFTRDAGWRPVSYAMKNVEHSRGCAGSELAGMTPLVSPIRFPCNSVASHYCSYDAGENTGVDDPTIESQRPSMVTFYVKLHAGNEYNVTTTYTVNASGRLVVESELVPGPQTLWPTTIESGRISVAPIFTNADPVPAQTAFAFTGACEVMGLGASVGTGSLVMIAPAEAWLRELKPVMSYPPLVRAIELDVAHADYNPTTRAATVRQPLAQVYKGATLEGGGNDPRLGAITLLATGGDVALRTAGGSPSIRIDGWSAQQFSVRKNGAIVASSASPFTLGGAADVDEAGALRISLRGDYAATDDITISR